MTHSTTSAAEVHCLRGVLAAMIIADGDVDADEISVACAVYERLTGTTLDAEALRSATLALLDEPTRVEATLAGLSRSLDLEAKERILGAALEVAGADGFVLEEEEAVLATVAAAMGLSEGQYRRFRNRNAGRED